MTLQIYYIKVKNVDKKIKFVNKLMNNLIFFERACVFQLI